MAFFEVIHVADQQEAAIIVQEKLEKDLQADTLHVLGLATGSTMIPIYKRLAESSLDFSEVTAFNLDEYIGLEPTNINSYAYFMQEHLFGHKPFKETNIPNGKALDLEAECARYENQLNEHPLDIQFLGVGENGHIAFNEPGTSFDSVTHVANLTDSTLGVNSQYFGDKEEIPNTAFTMGIASIMKAKKIILLAFGEKKRPAIEALLGDTITKEWPITILKKHPHVTIITDIK
ncbi:glucosamine-6-phosphate deaminase [Psychrobacillus lasiicapitis]|uniref:Glucosamine-6-phosphate deaminase n=1 Tax=Psychrobacillus lasiicapitis TaxID=1636719 RepID=A0A544TI19_9BACI|nr:glucosamine-6-phosphate deaminase [Psychrobacillus lasiicapitis]TQR17081.1 glucosamine-6-phosphate deaminase [Psychrobacillus lasiicapitis]GGA24721.1 glucosamine-6-phosphate deaminase [Psychrobacillus lasiicapitis]